MYCNPGTSVAHSKFLNSPNGARRFAKKINTSYPLGISYLRFSCVSPADLLLAGCILYVFSSSGSMVGLYVLVTFDIGLPLYHYWSPRYIAVCRAEHHKQGRASACLRAKLSGQQANAPVGTKENINHEKAGNIMYVSCAALAQRRN